MLIDLVKVEIHDGEAQVVVAPYQLTMLQTKCIETAFIEISPDVRVLGLAQKSPKIHFLYHAIIKAQLNLVFPGQRGRDDIDYFCVHFSHRLMYSGLTGLCSTKKSIHLDTISSARAPTISWKKRISLLFNGKRPKTSE